MTAMAKKKQSASTSETSPALHLLLHAWDSIPGGSYQRLNSGMFNALKTAIESGMRFDADDLAKVRGTGRWITGGGEGLYGLACGDQRGSDNISAAIALEQWLERPAVLWAERTKTATRLYVGAKFTWDGKIVTVTSMASESLVACTYHDDEESCRDEDAPVGSLVYEFRYYRRLIARKDLPGKGLIVELSGPVERDKRIDRRYKITYAELAAARKAYDTRRKGYEKRLGAATTLAEVDAIATAATSEGRRAFRHFDIEMLQEAVKQATERIRENMTEEQRAAEHDAEQARLEVSRQADLQRWLAGEDVHRHFDAVHLRVKDGYVETSTGQRATVESARLALTFIKRMRKKPAGWTASGKTEGPKVDLFDLEYIKADEVKVGCTRIPMSEIDRIAPLLKS